MCKKIEKKIANLYFLKRIKKKKYFKFLQKFKELESLNSIDKKKCDDNFSEDSDNDNTFLPEKTRSDLCAELKTQVSKKIKIKKIISFFTRLIKKLRQKRKRIRYKQKKRKIIIDKVKIRRFFPLLSKYRDYLPVFKIYYARKFINSKALRNNSIFLSYTVTNRIINQFFRKGKKIKSLKIFLQLIKDFKRLVNKPQNFRVFLPRFYKLRKLVSKFKVIVPRKGKRNRFLVTGAYQKKKFTRSHRLFITFRGLFFSVKGQKNRISFSQQLLLELLKIFTGRKCVFYELILRLYKSKPRFKTRLYIAKRLDAASFKYHELPNRLIFKIKKLGKKNKLIQEKSRYLYEKL